MLQIALGCQKNVRHIANAHASIFYLRVWHMPQSVIFFLKIGLAEMVIITLPVMT